MEGSSKITQFQPTAVGRLPFPMVAFFHIDIWITRTSKNSEGRDHKEEKLERQCGKICKNVVSTCITSGLRHLQIVSMQTTISVYVWSRDKKNSSYESYRQMISQSHFKLVLKPRISMHWLLEGLQGKQKMLGCQHTQVYLLAAPAEKENIFRNALCAILWQWTSRAATTEAR